MPWSWGAPRRRVVKEDDTRYRESALAAVFALVAPAALAQNLVTNAGFDTNVDFWTPLILLPGGSLVWSPLDWAGSPNSGSGLETNAEPAAGATTYRGSTCMVVPTTGLYEFGGHIRFPSGQATTGKAVVGLVIWDLPGCQGIGGILIPPASVTTATTDVWVPTLFQGFALNAGVNLQVYLAVTKDQAGGTLAAHFDFARFGLDGTTPVQLLEFLVE